jgi:hypothetical protein
MKEVEADEGCKEHGCGHGHRIGSGAQEPAPRHLVLEGLTFNGALRFDDRCRLRHACSSR